MEGTRDYRHTHPLPSAVASAVHSTIEAPSDQNLLWRCLHGGKQNRNEAINAVIWQLAADIGVSHFNDGLESIKLALKELGITPGLHCSEACKKSWTMIDCIMPAERALISPRRGENISEP